MSRMWLHVFVVVICNFSYFMCFSLDDADDDDDETKSYKDSSHGKKKTELAHMRGVSAVRKNRVPTPVSEEDDDV